MNWTEKREELNERVRDFIKCLLKGYITDADECENIVYGILDQAYQHGKKDAVESLEKQIKKAGWIKYDEKIAERKKELLGE